MNTSKPLCTCPRCGHRFVGPNIWHSCGRYELDGHFAGKDLLVRRMFDQLVRVARRCSPMTVYAQKTRIVFMVRVRFGGAVIRKLWLDFGL